MLTEEKMRELWYAAWNSEECRSVPHFETHRRVYTRLVEREAELSIVVTMAKALVAWAAEYAKANLWRTEEPPVAGWYLVPRRECNAPGESTGPPFLSTTIEAYWGGTAWYDATTSPLRYQPVHWMPEPEVP